MRSGRCALLALTIVLLAGGRAHGASDVDERARAMFHDYRSP